MEEDKLKRFYFTEYKNDDELVGELGLYIENLLALQKKEILEKIEKMKETPANRGMFMWVQGYNQAIKALKKHLT